MTDADTQVQKKKLSTGAKWGIGCGSGCLVVILIIAGIGLFGYFKVSGLIKETETELKSHGFEKVETGQMLEIAETITEPTLYKAQSVKILGDCKTDLAIMAQVAEIHGKVDGKVYFRGQVIMVQPNAELRNGLDVKAQLIQRYGKINGEITGVYQVIQPPLTPNAE